MSQSDYLHHKKISLELKSQNKLLPILSGMDYTLYKQFTLEKNIKNTSRLFNQLIPTGTQVIFGIETPKSDNCSDFILCKDTNTRPNRIAKNHIDFNISKTPDYVKHKKIRKYEKCCNINAPTDLVAVVSGPTTVSLAFTAPIGPKIATTYKLTSSPVGGETISTTSPLAVTGLVPNTFYTFTLKAVNMNGTSVESASSGIIITNPAAPTNLVATTSSGSVGTLTYTDSINGVASILTYTLISNPIGATTISTRSPYAITMASNTAYSFIIMVSNANGGSSYSTSSNIIISAPNAPINLIATASGSRTAVLKFTAPTGTEPLTYKLTSSPTGGVTSSTSSPLAITGLVSNTFYKFYLNAVNAFGDSSISNGSKSILIT